MPVLTGKLGQWSVPHLHMWKDRQRSLSFDPDSIIGVDSKIATIGSCFAAELASAMARLNLAGAMHPAGLFYNTKSIRQEFERIFEAKDYSENLGIWKTNSGYIHPLKAYRHVHPSELTLKEWSSKIDQDADRLFQPADVIVITLGLIEAWKTPDSDIYLPQIPHPDIFDDSRAVFCRLTVQDMLDDLDAIRTMVKKHTHAKLVLTVSPIPLHSTFTAKDVRVANTESKSRIRAAVSEFTDKFSDVHYFHSYELVTTAEKLSDFMLEDGRHVHRQAVDYILQQFLLRYAVEDLQPAKDIPAWLSAPEKTSARPQPTPQSAANRIIAQARHYLPDAVEDRVVSLAKELRKSIK